MEPNVNYWNWQWF